MCGVSLHIIPWQFRLKSLLFPKLQEYGSKKDQDGFARVVKAKTDIPGEKLTQPRTFQGCKQIYFMSHCTMSSFSHPLN